MFKKLRNKIESKRGSKSLFWKIFVLIKDFLWNIYLYSGWFYKYLRMYFYLFLSYFGFDNSKSKKFVILASARTGSTLLCNLLNSDPKITCYFEVFNPSNPDLEYLVTKRYRRDYPERFIQRIWDFSSKSKIVGFKLLFFHNKRALDFILKNQIIKKIILKRKNKIRQYISYEMVKKTKIWGIFKGEEDKIKLIKVKIDINHMLEQIKKNDLKYKESMDILNRSKQDFLEIYYEDLIGEKKDNLLFKVLEFIGCRNRDISQLKNKLIKMNPYSLKEIILNFNEVEKRLKNTKFEWMLYV